MNKKIFLQTPPCNNQITNLSEDDKQNQSSVGIFSLAPILLYEKEKTFNKSIDRRKDKFYCICTKEQSVT